MRASLAGLTAAFLLSACVARSATPISVSFNHPMMSGMGVGASLHENSATGPIVAGASRWSPDSTEITFTPATALKPRTAYVLTIAMKPSAAMSSAAMPMAGMPMSGMPTNSAMMARRDSMMRTGGQMSFSFTTD